MSDGGPTWKDYIDQGDATTRAQNDARFAEVISGIEKVGTLVTAQGAAISVRLDAIDGDLDKTAKAAEKAEAAANRSIWNTVFLGLTVVGLIFALVGLWTQAVEMKTGIISVGGDHEQPEASSPEQ